MQSMLPPNYANSLNTMDFHMKMAPPTARVVGDVMQMRCFTKARAGSATLGHGAGSGLVACVRRCQSMCVCVFLYSAIVSGPESRISIGRSLLVVLPR